MYEGFTFLNCKIRSRPRCIKKIGWINIAFLLLRLKPIFHQKTSSRCINLTQGKRRQTTWNRHAQRDGRQRNHIPPARVGFRIELVGVRVWSTRVFKYQHVHIGNTKWSQWESCPMRVLYANGFTFLWNIGLSLSNRTCPQVVCEPSKQDVANLVGLSYFMFSSHLPPPLSVTEPSGHTKYNGISEAFKSK